MLVGGGRSGKTFLWCRSILLRACQAPTSRHLIARLHFNHVRASIWLDTLPKVARICFPGLVLQDHRMDSFVSLPRYGSEVWFGGLDEKERAEKILGNEYATIGFNEVSQLPYETVLLVRTRLAQRVKTDKGKWLKQRAYYDLNPVNRRHWSNIEFIQKRSPVTGRPLERPERFAHAFMNPVDNIANLSPETIQEFDALPERQRLRFFLGQYSSELDGALWTFESIERARCLPEEVPQTLREVVIAVDPSGTTGEEEERSDEVGISVVGRGDDNQAYVLADLSCILPPEAWIRRVRDAFYQYRADRVVGEVNFGGDMLRALLHTADRNIPYRAVTASRGKAVRAEPVSALYGHQRDNGEWINDRVRHVGEFHKLEAEMMDFTAAGYVGVRSPSRADALVWALTDLMIEEPPSMLYTTPIARIPRVA